MAIVVGLRLLLGGNVEVVVRWDDANQRLDTVTVTNTSGVDRRLIATFDPNGTEGNPYTYDQTFPPGETVINLPNNKTARAIAEDPMSYPVHVSVVDA